MRTPRLLTLVAVVLTAGCAETATAPQSRPREIVEQRAVGDSTVTVVREGNLYSLIMQRGCEPNASLGALDARQGFGDPNEALLMISPNVPNPCGCPSTVTSPSWLPGWTCTLYTWYCPPGGGSSCSYKCTPPTRTISLS
jgi:hypothetical protein